MAYEKYDRFVPFSERYRDDQANRRVREIGKELTPIPRVQIGFNAHAFLKNKMKEAAERQDMTLNEWLCNAAIEKLERDGPP